MSIISRNQYPQSSQPEELNPNIPASAEQLQELGALAQNLWLAAQAGARTDSYDAEHDGLVASYYLKKNRTPANWSAVYLLHDLDDNWAVISERVHPSREMDPGELIRMRDIFPISGERCVVSDRIEACLWPRSARTLDERLPKPANSITSVEVIREGDDKGLLDERTAALMQIQLEEMYQETRLS